MPNFEGGRRHPFHFISTLPPSTPACVRRLGSMFNSNRFAVTRPFDPYVPEGAPLPRREARAIATAGLLALSELVELNNRQRDVRQGVAGVTLTRELDELSLRDVTLQLLHRLKFEGPFRVIRRCGHRIGYAAMTLFPEQQGLVMVTAPHMVARSNRKGGLGTSSTQIGRKRHSARRIWSRTPQRGQKDPRSSRVGPERGETPWGAGGNWSVPFPSVPPGRGSSTSGSFSCSSKRSLTAAKKCLYSAHR